MTTDAHTQALIEAAREALQVLDSLQGGCTDSDDGTIEALTVWCPEVVESLRAALAAAETQPDHLPGAGKMVQPAASTGWTGNADADLALILLDRLDDLGEVNAARIEQLEGLVRSLAAAPAAPAPAEVPPYLDVRKIMIQVVPGDDGMGHEVFARDVGDVQRLLSETFERLADLESNLPDPPAPAHPDDEAVDRFASLLKAKLAKARAKGRSGWADPAWPAADINRQLHEHAAKGDPLDVAAYAMFLALRGDAATGAPAPALVPLTNEQIDALADFAFDTFMRDGNDDYDRSFARAIERAHGIGSKA